MAQAHPYNQFFTSLGAKSINISSDTFKLMLLTNAYTPNKGTHRYQSDLTNELPSGNGYTTGGNVISGMTMNMTNTNAVQTLPAQPTNPFTITVTVGTNVATTASIAAAPTATTIQNALAALGNVGVGNVAVSGTGPYTITFQGSLGAQAITLMTTSGVGPVANTTPGVGTFYITGGNVSWPSATFIAPNAARYGAIVDTTPGVAASNPLVGLVDFVTDQSPTNGTLSVTWDPTGIVVVTVA